MPMISAPLLAALTTWPGPTIAASISPASKAAMDKGLRGMRINCISRPCFLNKPRSRATQRAVMLSLVTLPAKLVRVCAANRAGSTRANMTARTIEASTRISGTESLAAQLFIAIGLARFFLTNRLHIEKTVLRNVEIVAIRIRPAGLRIGPSIGTLLRQFVGIDLFHLLDDGLAVFDFEAEMVQTVGRVLFVVGDDGQVKITVCEENSSPFLFALVEHLHVKDVHIKRR